jgi:transcription elongation GreA/GreB family factor
MVPAAGGLEIAWGDDRLRTLTPVAPLGRALLGLRAGEEGSFQTPRGRRRFEILGVS